MKMQCIRCLSSMFENNGKKDCEFCKNFDVLSYARSNAITNIHGALQTRFVVVKDPNKKPAPLQEGQAKFDEVADAYGRATLLF